MAASEAAAVSDGLAAGRDYPRSPFEFYVWFPDDAACLAYLERLRWPDGFRCPRCAAAGAKAWHLSAGEVRCSVCRCETSITAGTIFDGTRLPLTTWFQAAWFVTNEKLGTSALALQRALCLSRYEAAWMILHKLRRAGWYGRVASDSPASSRSMRPTSAVLCPASGAAERDRVWKSRSQLELAIVEYVAWFNNERLHTSLGSVPPAGYEAEHVRR